MTYLRIEAGRFSYLGSKETQIAIEDLSLNQGQTLVVCGNSGSGKSTLTKLLNGISPEYIEGQVQGKFELAHLQAGKNGLDDYVGIVGSVFQNPRTQHFTLNTTDEVVLPCENIGLDQASIQKRLDWVVDLMGIDNLLDRPIFDLSGGEKQLIALASTLILHPQVLILDEVSSNLDQAAIDRIKGIVGTLQSQGMTLLIIDHRLEWTRGLADYYLKLAGGRVEKVWDHEAFQALSEDDMAQLGLRTNKPILRSDLHFSKDPVFKPVLDLNQLAVGYDFPLLEGINLAFSYGEVTAVIGPIGIGKSTLADVMVGLRQPLKGQVKWEQVSQDRKSLLAKSFIVMQDVNYQLFHHTVWHELVVGTKWEEADPQDEHNLPNRLLDRLDIKDLKNRHPMTLSGGEKQRVLIASAIVSGKEILIFDEPTSGFDYDHMVRFGKILQNLKEEQIVMLVFTHDYELAKHWCDRVVDIEDYRTSKNLKLNY